MFIKAVQKYTRQTPRKVRVIANTVKDLSLDEALRQLSVIERKATMVVSKVLRQAMADAVHNHGFQISDLSIDSIIVNEGPRYKRFRAVSRGRAHNVVKRSCHVTVVLKTADEETAVKEIKKEVKEVKEVKLEKKEKVAAEPAKK